MDFFSRQDDIKKRTRIFYVGFFLAVIFTVFILYFPVNVLFIMALSMSDWLESPVGYMLYGQPLLFFTPQAFILISAGISLTILLTAWHRRAKLLNGGGAFVAELLGGVELSQPKTQKESQFINVVEEMAIASGLPRPRIYILPREAGLNAVTAGETPADAVIAITQGAFDHFNRTELQAVIAHEFAHIFNGDSALNLRLAGWLYGLLCFATIGKELLWTGFKFKHKAALLALIPGLGIWLGGLVGKFSAEILEAAISRQREFLADAFAAQFTRDPKSLADALKKIGGVGSRSVVNSGQALSFKSFFIASPSRVTGLLKTHPPLKDRIFALEPSWDGRFPNMKLNAPAAQPTRNSNISQKRHLLLEKLNELDQWSGFLLAGILTAGENGQGAPSIQGPDIDAAKGLLNSIPAPLKYALNKTELLPALIAAVFLQDESPELYQKQLNLVENFFTPQTRLESDEFRRQMQSEIRLPLLDLAAPGLKHLSQEQNRQVSNMVNALIAADSKLDLFEIAAVKVLEKFLDGLFSNPAPNSSPENLRAILHNLRNDVTVILSAMAQAGYQEPTAAEQAFYCGISSFSQWSGGTLIPADELSSKKILQALERLSKASLQIKNNLLIGAAACSLHDHKINKEEYELLRALAAALDLNLPYIKISEQINAPAKPLPQTADNAYNSSDYL